MKKVEESQIQRVVGIDAHPDLFSAAIFAGAGHGQMTSSEPWRVFDGVGLKDMEKWARKWLRSGDTVVFEASGNSFALAERFAELGLELRVLVLESQQAGKIRSSYCNTDKTAAIKLARVYMSGMAKVVWQPDERTRTRREVLHRHRQAVNNATRGKNRIKSFLSDHCVRMGKGFQLTGKNALALVSAKYPWTELQEQMLRMMFQEMLLAESHRRQLRAIMAAEVLEDPLLLQLVRLMGIRHISAYAVGAVVGQVSRFANPKKLVAYLGLSPGFHRSGLSVKGSSSLTSFGRKDLRSILVQVAQNAMNRIDHPLHKWGWRLCLRKGHRNIAVVAVARKIAVALWHLMMGHMTPLVEKENIPSIRERISKLVAAVGFQNYRSRGYPSKALLIDEKLGLIFRPA